MHNIYSDQGIFFKLGPLKTCISQPWRTHKINVPQRLRDAGF